MIEIQDLKKSFGTKDVLNGVSLQVGDGMIYGLVGRNGAGKTTLITTVAGLQSPTAGQCRVNGKPVIPHQTGTTVGYLPDVPAYFDFLTVGEYLDFLFIRPNPQRRKYLLELVQLSPDTKIRTMSRGMKQRLGIAAVLANDPDAVLLDEPTSALDPQGRYELSVILRELKAQGKSVILSTHILTDMEKLCDEVGFLNRGVIVKSLRPKDMMDSDSLRVTFAQPVSPDALAAPGLEITPEEGCAFSVRLSPDPGAQQRLFARLAELHVPVTSIHTQQQSLDAIFQEVCL